MYQINNSNFVIDNAAIIAVVTSDRKLKWAIDLYAYESELEGQNVIPKFSFTDLEETNDFTYNKNFLWKSTSAYDTLEEKWIGVFLFLMPTILSAV